MRNRIGTLRYLDPLDYIQWDLTPTLPPVAPAEGLMYWDIDDGTLNLGMPGGEVNLQIGQEMLMRVTNGLGIQIDNGTPVYISGASGSNIIVGLADADFATAVGFRTIAVATEDITAGQKGYVTTQGFVRDFDTDGFAEGSPLYLASGGGFSNAPSTAPDITVLCGIVTRESASVGEMYVSINSIPNYNNLSDVLLSSLANNEVMQWVSASDTWQNTSTLTGITLGTPWTLAGDGLWSDNGRWTWSGDKQIRFGRLATIIIDDDLGREWFRFESSKISVGNFPTTFADSVTIDDVLTVEGLATFGGNIIVPDGGTIGTATGLGEDIITIDGTLGEVTIDGQINLDTDGFISNVTAGSIRAGIAGGTFDQYVEWELDSFDGTVLVNTNASTFLYNSNFILKDNKLFSFGNQGDAQLLWNSADNDRLQILTPVNATTGTGYVTLLEKGDKNLATRYVGVTLNPTFRVYSSDAAEIDDWIEIYHNQTNGVLDVGNGALSIPTETFIGLASPTDFSKFETDGTLEFNGAAEVWDDILGAIDTNQVQTPNAAITVDDDESSVTFETGCDLTDWAWMNVQMSHSWKQTAGANVHPHIHWWQTSANVPNWLIEYRWQRNGETKTTTWSRIALETSVSTYVTGTLCQITGDPTGIAPPTGFSISDVIQIRIIRDIANDSTLFDGAETSPIDQDAVSVDLHYEKNTVGSRTEFGK